MHLISFDASSRQLGKLKKGLPVRIKKGTGFNLVVNPSNYHLVSRAFGKNKGMELKLSPEELNVNQTISPEEHEALQASDGHEKLPFMEGGNIFKKIKRGIRKLTKNKTVRKIEKELRPLTREMKKVGKEIAHEKIAEAHMAGADKYGDNERASRLINLASNMAHEKVQGAGIESFLRKASHVTGNELKRASTTLRGGVQKAQSMAGLGLYAYPQHGRGMNAHHALKLAGMATAQANHQLAKMHNASVHGQLTQPPIKRYWDDALSPPSRGTGIHNHMNLIRGRGSLIAQDHLLPPALQSQPYGANFHMQFFLPPEYHRYNDGGDMEGRGMYI